MVRLTFDKEQSIQAEKAYQAIEQVFFGFPVHVQTGILSLKAAKLAKQHGMTEESFVEGMRQTYRNAK